MRPLALDRTFFGLEKGLDSRLEMTRMVVDIVSERDWNAKATSLNCWSLRTAPCDTTRPPVLRLGRLEKRLRELGATAVPLPRWE